MGTIMPWNIEKGIFKILILHIYVCKQHLSGDQKIWLSRFIILGLRIEVWWQVPLSTELANLPRREHVLMTG